VEAAADGEGEHAGDADDGDEKREAGEAAEDDGVEAIGSHDFCADVVESAGAFDGLIVGHVVDFAGENRHERVRITLGAHEEAAAETILVAGLINRHRWFGYEAGVVELWNDADDAARLWAHVAELEEGIGPVEFVIERILAGEELFGECFADDDDAFGAGAIVVVEVATLEEGNTHRGEKVGGDGTETGARIFFAVFFGRAVDGELHVKIEGEGITPGNDHCGGNFFDAGERSDAAANVAIERGDLFG